MKIKELQEKIDNSYTMEEWNTFRKVELAMHKSDILTEISYRIENEEIDADFELDDQTLSEMVEDYEDGLGNDENWHYVLNNSINKFVL